MLSEDFVSYAILRTLLHHGWTVLQYHPPGGGAGYPVHFSHGQTIYPDITALKKRQLLVMENKARYHTTDVAKLRAVALDAGALKTIQTEAMARAAAKRVKISSLSCIRFAHGYAGKVAAPLPDVEMFQVAADGSTTHVPALNVPFPL